jgi:hypothetical protein
MGTNIPADIPENIFASMTNFGKRLKVSSQGKFIRSPKQFQQEAPSLNHKVHILVEMKQVDCICHSVLLLLHLEDTEHQFSQFLTQRELAPL